MMLALWYPGLSIQTSPYLEASVLFTVHQQLKERKSLFLASQVEHLNRIQVFNMRFGLAADEREEM